MSAPNSGWAPLARRALLSDRVEQLRRMLEIRAVEDRIQKAIFRRRGARQHASMQWPGSGVRRRRPRPPAGRILSPVRTRGHGHALALGLSPEAVIGEICGRTVGCAGGLGGSMHLVEPSIGLLPTAAIKSAPASPIACGVALAAKAPQVRTALRHRSSAMGPPISGRSTKR